MRDDQLVPDAPAGHDTRLARRIGVAGTALALIGLGLSIYLTVAHYGDKAILACPEHGTVDCAKVTTSSYAVQHGAPLAVLGLGFFVVTLILQVPPLWVRAGPVLRAARVGVAAVGALSALWLIWVELFRLDAICLYCTGVHAVAIGLFALTGLGTAALAPTD